MTPEEGSELVAQLPPDFANDEISKRLNASAKIEAAMPLIIEFLQNVESADYKTWDEGYDNPAEFVAWAKSRARHVMDVAGIEYQ